jgi:hypothetical protein
LQAEGQELPKIMRLPNECAIATVLSASPNAFFELMVVGIHGELSEFWNAYLTRLLAEGTPFTQEQRLGILIFSLASLAWRPSDVHHHCFMRARGGETFVGLMDELLKKPNVREAVRFASRLYFVSAMSDNTVECKVKGISRDVLPDGVTEAIVIDKRYAMHMTGMET